MFMAFSKVENLSPVKLQYYTTQQASMLDLDKIGPDWNLAVNHGLACTPGRPVREPTTTTSIDNQPKHTFCECCLNIIHKNPISLCENSKELEFLGFGFPLYFIFTKYTIILLLLQIVAYSALSISWALNSSYDICAEGAVRELPGGLEGKCTSWLLKFMRTELEVSHDEVILRLSSFLIHLVGLVYMRDMIRKTNNYYDERTTSLSDYSVLFRNLPKKLGTEKRIREFLREGFRGREQSQQFKMEELMQLDELEDFYHLRDEKQTIIKEKQKWLRKQGGEERTEKLKELDKQLLEKRLEMDREHEKQKKMIAMDEVKCEKAIVVMESESAKNAFLELFEDLDKQKLIQYFGEGGENIEIVEAPEPKEIIWENINYPQEKRVVRLIIGWTLTALFIAAVTAVFYGILTAKGHAVESALKKIEESHRVTNPDEIEADTINAHALEQQALVATFLTMLLIIIFNKFCFSFVLHIFTDIEKHRTGSGYEFSFGLKYTLGLFFTTALMTLLVEDIAFQNIYKESYGVVEEESIMFFFSAFLVPLIWIINPWHIFKVIKRRLFKDRTDYTQRQANALMENPNYSMGKKYAQLIESIWFTYLYYSVIPAGSIIIFFGLILSYWVDKYTLLRRSSINENVNGELSMNSMKLVDATLILRAAGELIFDSQIRHSITWESIVCICIGTVYLFLPMNKILDFFHEEKFRAEEKPYSEVKTKFIENYHTMHPLYAQEKYALISGVDLTAHLISMSHKCIMNNDGQQFNPTKQELVEIKLNSHSVLMPMVE